MSEALGLAAFEEPRHWLFLDATAAARAEYSEDTARRIDAEVERLLEERAAGCMTP